MLTQWLLSVFIVRISGFDDAGTYSLAMSIANVFYNCNLWNEKLSGFEIFQVNMKIGNI